MNYYNEIKSKIIDNENYARIKDYSKEKQKVITYYEIGKLLTEAGSKYGENILGKYSERLMLEVGKKYNIRTLRRMKQFYIVFQKWSPLATNSIDDNQRKWSALSTESIEKNEKVSTMSTILNQKNNIKVSPLATQLTWSHYCELLTLKDMQEINYYIEMCKKYNLSTRELRERIKNNEYKRLDNFAKEQTLYQEQYEVTNFIKNPIIINTSHPYNKVTEKILKYLILEDLDNFLKELGRDFVYVGNEYKIKIGDRYNYIDILLYNLEYHCYVVVELKITELKSEHIGQVEKYMNYIDKNVRRVTDNETVGLIICKKENKLILEYCSEPRIFETTYLLKSL